MPKTLHLREIESLTKPEKSSTLKTKEDDVRTHKMTKTLALGGWSYKLRHLKTWYILYEVECYEFFQN